MAHTHIYKDCENCGQSFTMKGLQTVQRQQQARFCSVACRSAFGRRDVVCRHCGNSFSLKAHNAKDRQFCSRACMFAAWGCSICSRIRPQERRRGGDPHCSDRCTLTAALEKQALTTGLVQGVCGTCLRILPAEEFTKDRSNRNGLSGKCKACTRRYYGANKDEYRRRRYGYQAVPGGILVDFTPDQKADRFSMWGGRCWVCGINGATEDDHVKPISRGGSHCLSNLRPICKKCNASKGGRWPLPTSRLQPNFSHPSPRPGNAAAEVTPRSSPVAWTCPHCLQTTRLRAHLAGTRKYCSRRCVVEARRGTTLDKQCTNPLCRKPFKVPAQKGTKVRKFCSIECAWIARNRPAHWKNPIAGQPTLF